MAAVTPGRFIWHELLSTDPDAAIPFYRKVVGWDVTLWDQDPGYRMFTWNSVPVAGVMQLPEPARESGAPPHWISYVSVRNSDQTVAQAVRMGAMTYLEPMDVPTVGRVAVLADPQGATFGVYEPATSSHPSQDLALGDFSWHELAADDWKTAWEVYRALFGWEYESQFDMGAMGTYWIFRRVPGARPLGGMFNRPPEIPHAHWLPYVHVASAHRAAELGGKHGGRVLNGPMEVPGGDYITQLMDPQGATFAVHAQPAKTESVPVPAKPAAPPQRRAVEKPAATRSRAKPAATRKPVKKTAPARPAKRPVKKSAPRRKR
jgi:predicted enzyme related to lactoylglutathione lyase